MQYAAPPPADSPFLRWNEVSMQASIAGNRPWNNVPNYARWMREIGFEDVQERRFFLATGTWPKDDVDKKLGAWQLENWLAGLEGMTVRNLARIGWGAEESKDLVAKVKKELLDGDLKPFNDILVVWGRKPESGEGVET
jgi:hypothetical protein